MTSLVHDHVGGIKYIASETHAALRPRLTNMHDTRHFFRTLHIAVALNSKCSMAFSPSLAF